MRGSNPDVEQREERIDCRIQRENQRIKPGPRHVDDAVIKTERLQKGETPTHDIKGAILIDESRTFDAGLRGKSVIVDRRSGHALKVNAGFEKGTCRLS